MEPYFFLLPIFRNWNRLLEVAIGYVLTKDLWHLYSNIYNASLLLLENRCSRYFSKDIIKMSSPFRKFSEFSNVALMVVFNNWDMISLEKSKSLIGHNASVFTIIFNHGIEIYRDFCIFN